MNTADLLPDWFRWDDLTSTLTLSVPPDILLTMSFFDFAYFDTIYDGFNESVNINPLKVNFVACAVTQYVNWPVEEPKAVSTLTGGTGYINYTVYASSVKKYLTTDVGGFYVPDDPNCSTSPNWTVEMADGSAAPSPIEIDGDYP